MIHQLTYRQKSDGYNLNCNVYVDPCKIIYIQKNLVVKRRSPTECAQHLFVHPSPHFFLPKRLNFLSFFAELGSGRAAEVVEGVGRVWALAPEGPEASSTVGS